MQGSRGEPGVIPRAVEVCGCSKHLSEVNVRRGVARIQTTDVQRRRVAVRILHGDIQG